MPYYSVLCTALYANALLFRIIYCFICKCLQAQQGQVQAGGARGGFEPCLRAYTQPRDAILSLKEDEVRSRNHPNWPILKIIPRQVSV